MLFLGEIQAENRQAPHRGWLWLTAEGPKKAACRIWSKEHGPRRSNKLAMREPRCEGEGGEGSNECNDSNEDEGAEARRAVHRLARGRPSERAVTAAVGCWVVVCVVTGASSLAGAGVVVCSVVFADFLCVFFFVGATAARFEAVDFFAISFASSSALIFFASSLATSSASKDWWWKIFGMGTVMLNLS